MKKKGQKIRVKMNKNVNCLEMSLHISMRYGWCKATVDVAIVTCNKWVVFADRNNNSFIFN